MIRFPLFFFGWQTLAVANLCNELAQCKDPVCSNYYNDPDVERICGICTMSAAGFFGGCFAGHSQARHRNVSTLQLGFIRILSHCRWRWKGAGLFAWIKSRWETWWGAQIAMGN